MYFNVKAFLRGLLGTTNMSFKYNGICKAKRSVNVRNNHSKALIPSKALFQILIPYTKADNMMSQVFNCDIQKQ